MRGTPLFDGLSFKIGGESSSPRHKQRAQGLVARAAVGVVVTVRYSIDEAAVGRVRRDASCDFSNWDRPVALSSLIVSHQHGHCQLLTACKSRSVFSKDDAQIV